jgi:hypothetical protein
MSSPFLPLRSSAVWGYNNQVPRKLTRKRKPICGRCEHARILHDLQVGCKAAYTEPFKGVRRVVVCGCKCVVSPGTHVTPERLREAVAA